MAAINAEGLRREMALRGITSYELADLTGVSRVTISAALNGHSVQASTVRKLAAALTSTPVLRGAEAIVAGSAS